MDPAVSVWNRQPGYKSIFRYHKWYYNKSYRDDCYKNEFKYGKFEARVSFVNESGKENDDQKNVVLKKEAIASLLKSN